MGVRGILAAMVGGSALAIVVAVTQCEPRRAGPEPAALPLVPVAPAVAPWLTAEAQKELVRAGVHMGALFDGVVLGGPAPAPAVRDRIAAFARSHDIAIDVDVVDGLVSAVRLDVLFRGAGGYEGADAFAIRFERPSIEIGCYDCPDTWVNDWAYEEAGEIVRGRVRVNRVQVRWERAWTPAELLAFADGLVGADTQTIQTAAPDRWRSGDAGHYIREVPYLANPVYGNGPRFEAHGVPGLDLVAPTGRITEVSFVLHVDGTTERAGIERAVLKHWGRVRVDEGTMAWKLRDRRIDAYWESSKLFVKMSAR